MKETKEGRTMKNNFVFYAGNEVREIKDGVFKIKGVKEEFKISSMSDYKIFEDDVYECKELIIISETSNTKFVVKDFLFVEDKNSPIISKKIKNLYNEYDRMKGFRYETI